MNFRTRYSEHRPETYGFQTVGDSLTRQSEKDEADINLVMERFVRTGQLPISNYREPQYGDARAIPYDQALMIVKTAEEAFKSLPSKTRAFFHNSPQKLEEFLSDPKNDELAIELGLREFIQPSSEQLLTEVVKNTKKDPKSPENKS